jgi:hypothetical protein
MVAVETLLVNAIVVLLCAGACLYLYIRISFMEKKISMMESILVDVKVAMDSFLQEEPNGGPVNPIPISSSSGPYSPPVELGPGASLGENEAETIPEENFYSSVLAAAHEEADASAPATEAPGTSAEEALAGIQNAETAAVEADEPLGTVSTSAPQVGPNYDAMTKQELTTLAEQRGLRAKKTMNRSELINLLRRSESAQNHGSTTGSDGNVAGSIVSSIFPATESLDGDFPVDLGQSTNA